MNSKSQVEWELREVGHAEWQRLWVRVPFSNIVQSWEYGDTKSVQGWRAARYAIVDTNGNTRGVLQVLVRSLRFFGGIAIINRGPLFFQDLHSHPLTDGELRGCWLAVRGLIRNNLWWYLACNPELKDGDSLRNVLRAARFFLSRRKVSIGSIRLSLSPTEDELFMNLKSKWRNLLRKGMKMKVEVDEITDENEIVKLVNIYDNFQKQRGFSGVPRPLLAGMISQSNEKWRFRVYRSICRDSAEISGFVFVVEHGQTASYLVGWTSDTGRKQQDNYVLLWSAIVAAKKNGVSWFDMGGVNEKTPKGIAHFKRGVNGEVYSLSPNCHSSCLCF